MYLVTGATGNVGRQVIVRLCEQGRKVRALTRDPASAELPPGVDVVEGDLSRPESLGAALDGVSAVFLFAVPGSGRAFVSAAEAAGVRSVVLLSSGAIDDTADHQPNMIAAYHAEIENEIRASGLTWTILRPGVFAANALVWRHQLIRSDTFSGPYPGAATAPVHEADIADVAVAALTEGGHVGAVHELTGPESLTFEDQLARLGGALGRKLRWEEQRPEEARRVMLDQRMPPPIVDTLLEQWADSVGASAPTTDTVERITGRPARTFARWAADHAADFR